MLQFKIPNPNKRQTAWSMWALHWHFFQTMTLATPKQYKAFRSETIHITTQTPCLAKKRTDSLGKSRCNIPIYFKFCISFYYSSKEKGFTNHTENGNGLQKDKWATWVLVLSHNENRWIFSKLHEAKLFSTLDVRYNCSNITATMMAKNILLSQKNMIIWVWVPFGIHATPSYFAMMINETLKGLGFCYVYLHDIITYSKSEKEHLRPYQTSIWPPIQSKLQIKVHIKWCFKSQIDYLGRILSLGISSLPEKLDAIRCMPPPQNIKELTVLRTYRLLKKLHQSLCQHHSYTYMTA